MYAHLVWTVNSSPPPPKDTYSMKILCIKLNCVGKYVLDSLTQEDKRIG